MISLFNYIGEFLFYFDVFLQEETCLSQSELLNAKQLLALLQSVLLPALNERSAEYQCGRATSVFLNVDEVSQLFSENLKPKV